jgi:methyl-accepting chemotaxis protein
MAARPEPAAARPSIEHLPVAAFTTDAATRITAWNAEMEALTGKSAADVMGKRVWQAFSAKRITTAVDEAVLSGGDAEGAIELSGGVSLPLKARPALDEQGEVVGVQVVSLPAPVVQKGKTDGRMESFLAASQMPVMLADHDLRITAMNPQLVSMLGKYATRMREVFPNFDLNNLIGQNIDVFHKNPHHQRRLLGDATRLPHKANIKVGRLEFGLNAMAIRDSEGNVIAYAVEWADFNPRRDYTEEVQRLRTAIENGRLADRGDLAALDESFHPAMRDINTILDAATAPLAEIREKLALAADGDLRAYVRGDYAGDHGQLKEAVNQVLTSLNETLGQVAGAAAQIASGSVQVASSAQSLSAGATKQAAAIEEITASISEMTDQTRKNAENANQASTLATAAGDMAARGDAQMKSMLAAMLAIDEASQNIGKIIKVIDEIAFQTNLLALNAAVEAARAGVHGKGFAVVAEEVRNLAARSANAARETTTMIEGTIKKVNQGMGIANETAQALSHIVQSVQKASRLVNDIATASNEQALGIEQISVGLRQVDQVTQQNTAGAEESAAASEELSAQSAQLREMLGRFQLAEVGGDDGGGDEAVTPELLAAVRAWMNGQKSDVNLRSNSSAPFQRAPSASRAPSPSRPASPARGTGKPGGSSPFGDDDMGRY